MAASDALSPRQKDLAYRRWQETLRKAPRDFHTTTVAAAGAFAYNNLSASSYPDYGDYDDDDYGDDGGDSD